MKKSHISPCEVFCITQFANAKLLRDFNERNPVTGNVRMLEKIPEHISLDAIVIWLLNDLNPVVEKQWKSLAPDAFHIAIIPGSCPQLFNSILNAGAFEVYELQSWNEVAWMKLMHHVDHYNRMVSENNYLRNTLLQSNDAYRVFMDQHVDPIVIFDMQGNILDANNLASDLLGYSLGELKRLNFFQVIAPGEHTDLTNEISRMQKGSVRKEQIQVQRKSGKFINTELHMHNICEGVYLAAIRDLTDRIRAQEYLQKEKLVADKIINSLPGVFYMFNQKGEYLRWNRQLEILSGYTGQEIINMHPSEFFSKHEHALLEKEIGNVFQYGQSALEAHLLTKQGSLIPYYFTGVSVAIEGELCLLGMGIDLSPLRNLEQKLSRQKLAEQQKMMQVMLEAEETEKNKLGLELHDNVNQILSVVRLYLSTILNEKEKASVTIADTIELLTEAINEIRHLSHSLAIAYKFDTGLVNAIEDLVEKIQAGNEMQVALKLPEALDERTTYQQKLAIYRIMQEQFNNIIKYAQARNVTVYIQFTDHHLTLTISDDGVGFHVNDASGGLGLMSMRNRAEALHGNFTINSSPSKGTTLIVNLPVGVR